MDDFDFHLDRLDGARIDDSRLACFVEDWLFMEELVEVFEDA